VRIETPFGPSEGASRSGMGVESPGRARSSTKKADDPLSTALRISFEPDNETAKQFVTNSLDNFNIATTGQAAYWPVAYFLRGPDNEILGGLLGEIWGHWLHIKYIWVAEPARGEGHARTLVSAAEDYATRRGCVGAFLETSPFRRARFTRSSATNCSASSKATRRGTRCFSCVRFWMAA
jgi:GNAT superfamily N-acetyltransferase